MTVLEAVVQGLIQGFTEFLPVSSSGHLILGSTILGLRVPGLSFSIMLHVGTGFAVLVMLRKEIAWIIRSIFSPEAPEERQKALRLSAYVVLASVPAAFVGIVFSDLVERSFSSGGVAAVGLIITGFILRQTAKRDPKAEEEAQESARPRRGQEYPSYRSSLQRENGLKNRRAYRPAGACVQLDMPSVTLQRAVQVGFSQAFAIIPGISRSGTTIVSGLLAGVNREDAARFSFLLSLPAAFGAAFLDVLAASKAGVSVLSPEALAGAITSFLAGLFALAVVFRVVRRGELSSFSYYCWIAGFLSLLYLMFA